MSFLQKHTVLVTFLISIENSTLFQRKQQKIRQKNRGFVYSEFVKTCNEHVNVHGRTLILLSNAISAFAKKEIHFYTHKKC